MTDLDLEYTPTITPSPGVNLYITTCVHGVDLRFWPRCYLCHPEMESVLLESKADPLPRHGETHPCQSELHVVQGRPHRGPQAMTTHDTPEAVPSYPSPGESTGFDAQVAALAAALDWTAWKSNPHKTAAGQAAAILAALPPGWCGHGWISEEEHDRQSSVGAHLFDPMCGYCASGEIDRQEAEIARLWAAGQEVLAADVACAREEVGCDRRWDEALAALSAALAPAPSRCNCPESGTSGSCPFHDNSTIASSKEE